MNQTQTQNQTKNLPFGEAKETILLMDTLQSKLYKRVYADGTVVFSLCRYPRIYSYSPDYCYHIELRQDYVALAATNYGETPYRASSCKNYGEYCVLLKLPATALNAEEWKKIVDDVMAIRTYKQFFGAWENIEEWVEDIEAGGVR